MLENEKKIMSFLCLNKYACLGCSYCEESISYINCAAYLSPEERAMIAKHAHDIDIDDGEPDYWFSSDMEFETRLRIDGVKFHSAKHGVPSGDHAIRAWRKRLCNKLGRRLNRELIREQIEDIAA